VVGTEEPLIWATGSPRRRHSYAAVAAMPTPTTIATGADNAPISTPPSPAVTELALPLVVGLAAGVLLI
jgi:hypothetical protein